MWVLRLPAEEHTIWQKGHGKGFRCDGKLSLVLTGDLSPTRNPNCKRRKTSCNGFYLMIDVYRKLG
jgi:hypothetical protein